MPTAAQGRAASRALRHSTKPRQSRPTLRSLRPGAKPAAEVRTPSGGYRPPHVQQRRQEFAQRRAYHIALRAIGAPEAKTARLTSSPGQGTYLRAPSSTERDQAVQRAAIAHEIVKHPGRADALVDHAAELGLVDKKPHNLVSAIGDLIPDTPSEIALTAAGAGVGNLARAGKAAKDVGEAATETKKVAQAADETSKLKTLSRVKAKVEARPRPVKAAKAKVAASKPAQAVKTGATKAAEKTPKPLKAAGRVTKTATAPVRFPLKKVGQHPGKAALGVTVGPGAVSAAKSGHPSDITTPLTAYEDALVHHPGDVLGTTARAIPGFVTAPVGIAANVGLSGYRASREALPGPLHKHYSGAEILAPTKEVGKQNLDFAKGLVETFGSGDKARIENAIRHDYGLTPLAIAGIPGAKALHGHGRGEITAPEAGLGHIHFKVGDREVAPVRNRRIRRQVSREAAGARRKGEAEAAAAAKPLVKLARKLPGAKKTLRHRKGVGPEDTVKIAAEEGIRTKEHAVKARERLGARPAGHQDKVLAHDALDYLIAHPELLKNKHYEQLLYHYRQQAREIETSAAKKHSAQALTHGVKLPEQRIAQKATQLYGRDFTGLAENSARRAQILKQVENKHGAQINKAFEDDMRKLRQEQGLAEPSYAADVKADRGDSLQATPAYPKRMSSKQHKSENILRKAGTADQSFGTLLQKSVISPRMRQAAHEHVHSAAEAAALPVHVDGPHGTRTVRYMTSNEIRKAVDEGQLDPARHAVLDAQHFRQAVLDPNKAEVKVQDYRTALEDDIARREAEAKAALNISKGKKYIVADRAALDEITKQYSPTHVPILGKLQRASSAAILGYSPAWLMAQPLAEGAQALAAVGPLHMARGLLAYRKLSDAEKRRFDAEIGATSGIGSVQETAMSLGGDLAETRTRMGKALERSAPGRVVRGLLTGRYAAAIDRSKGTAIRRAVAAGHLTREYNGFRGALRGLMREQDTIARDLKGKSLPDQLAYFTKNDKAARKLETYVDDVMGNWTALTHNERLASSVVIFYPFVRMSLEWTFHTFPANHPLKASIMHFLGQENANQVEQMLHGKPSFFTQWANVPLYAGRGKDLGKATGTIPLARIAPGSNALIEAIGQGNGPRDLTHLLNPALAAGISAIGGYNPSSGSSMIDKFQQPGYGDVGKALAGTLGYLPAPLRISDQALNEGKIGRALLGKSSGPTSEFFQNHQGNYALHSLIPFAPQSTSGERQKAQVGSLINRKYAPLADVNKAIDLWKKGDKAEAEKIASQTLDALAAKKVLDRLYRKQGLITSEPLPGAAWKFVKAITGEDLHTLDYNKALNLFRDFGLDVGPKKLQRAG